MKSTYQIDPAHSSVQFSVRHMMISNVRGSFSKLGGTVVYDPADLDASNVQAVIETSSINTLDEKRDAHLKSPDFLDAERFPKITFQSRKIQKAGSGGLKITGDLTVYGTTKEVALNVEDISPEAKDPWGNLRIGASANAKINRNDFGLTWNAALEAGGFLVGDEVKLQFELELMKIQSAAA